MFSTHTVANHRTNKAKIQKTDIKKYYLLVLLKIIDENLVFRAS